MCNYSAITQSGTCSPTVQKVIQPSWKSEHSYAHSHRGESTYLYSVQQVIHTKWKIEGAHIHRQCHCQCICICQLYLFDCCIFCFFVFISLLYLFVCCIYLFVVFICLLYSFILSSFRKRTSHLFPSSHFRFRSVMLVMYVSTEMQSLASLILTLIALVTYFLWPCFDHLSSELLL